MTTIPVAHIARLLQDINQHFHDANVHLSKAWGAYMLMRDEIFHLTGAYHEWMQEVDVLRKRSE